MTQILALHGPQQGFLPFTRIRIPAMAHARKFISCDKRLDSLYPRPETRFWLRLKYTMYRDVMRDNQQLIIARKRTAATGPAM
eukprot:scaffold2640_cov376-Prasinococcus_capsulatus_cf.AAC.11